MSFVCVATVSWSFLERARDGGWRGARTKPMRDASKMVSLAPRRAASSREVRPSVARAPSGGQRARLAPVADKQEGHSAGNWCRKGPESHTN